MRKTKLATRQFLSVRMPNTHRRRRGDETVLWRRRRRCEQNSQLAHDDCRRIRSTILKLTNRPLAFDYTSFDRYWEHFQQWRHYVVIVEKVTNIYQNSRSQTAMESIWPVSKLSTESVGSRRELVANSFSHRRRDKTVSSRRRRRCVLGIKHYCVVSRQLGEAEV